MTERSRLICSITAFAILALFVSIEYLPADWILELYVFSTQKVIVFEMLIFIPLMLFFGIKDKEWGYALFLIIVMTGQVMFVHVYADNYYLEIKSDSHNLKNIQNYDISNWSKA